MKNRIICFVNVPEDAFMGLPKILEVNLFCETYLFKKNDDDGYITILGQGDNNFLFISSTNVHPASSVEYPPDNWEILLVHDSIKISQLPDSFYTPSTLILYHKNASWKENAQSNQLDDDDVAIKMLLKNNKIKQYVQGQHEPNDKYYPLISEIAKSWVQNEDGKQGFDDDKYKIAFDKLAEVIFDEKIEELNPVLEFLHNCLEGKEKADINKLQHFQNFSTIKNLYNELSGDFISNEYIETLEKLRDEVLSEVKK
jgi:hypothetical protein